MKRLSPKFAVATITAALTFASGVPSAFVLNAAGAEWIGGTDSSWTTASNWKSGSVPAASDAINITKTASYFPLIKDGNSITTGYINSYGPTSVTMTGGSLTLNGRWRIGGSAGTGTSSFNFSGGTLAVGNGSNDYGFTMGASQVMTMNISGSAKLVNPRIFNLHAGASTTEASTINMSGGSVFLTDSRFIIAEGGLGVMNLTGGVVSTNYLQMGRNESDTLNGNTAYRNSRGFLNIGSDDKTGDGQIYIRNTANIGTQQKEATGTGTITLNSGIFSVKTLNLTDGRSALNLNGGTFLAQTVNGSVANAGSVVEITSNFDASQSAIEALAQGETFFSAKQQGTVGTMTVSGSYAQSAGTLVLDVVGDASYDVLNAASFNITGGTLQINAPSSLPSKETVYAVFGDSPVGAIQFNSITATQNASRWMIEDNLLAYRAAESFTWKGTESSDWSGKSNWNSSSQFLPDMLDTVYIGSKYAQYANKPVISDGDNAMWKLGYLNGGELEMTGGTLSTYNRLRIGNEASATFNISGGTWIANKTSGDGGVMIGAAKGDAYYSEMNVSGDAYIRNSAWFGTHGYSRSAINQSGGTIFNDSSAIVQFGEGDYEAAFNLSGGTFYNVNRISVGTNDSYNAASGNGRINVSDDGELYNGGELRIGRDNYGYGELNISGGLVSSKQISLNNGGIKLTGGTLVTEKITRSGLTNEGGTIEIASNYLTQAQYDALGEGENYFTKYQDGSIGSMTVNGLFRQIDGQIVIDIIQQDDGSFTYDSIIAENFDITGGDLYLELLELPESGTSFEIFSISGTNDFGMIDFDSIFSSAEGAQLWVLNEGTLTFYTPDAVPEPSTLVLLTLGLGVCVGLRRNRRAEKQ